MPRGAPSTIFSIASVKSRISTSSWLAAGGGERGLVGEVGEVGADHARRRRGEPGERDVLGQREAAGVDGEDLRATLAVGRRDGDAAVEAAGAQERGVEDLRPVGRAEHDHGDVGLEAVHLREDLVQRLLALVVAAAERGAGGAAAADRVELVDEDDRRRGLLGLLEEVAHTRGADADDRLDELGRADREERRLGLPRHRAGEQRLARAGRPESSTPRGIRPPSFWYFSGFFRKSTISMSSALASSMPATSSNVTFCSPPSARRARERPKLPSAPIGPPPPARRARKTNRPMSRITGPKPRIRLARNPRLWFTGSASMITPLSSSSSVEVVARLREGRDLGVEVLAWARRPGT